MKPIKQKATAPKKESELMKSVTFELRQLNTMITAYERLDEQARQRAMDYFISRFSKYVKNYNNY